MPDSFRVRSAFRNAGSQMDTGGLLGRESVRAQARPVGTVSRGVQHCLGGDGIELAGLHLSPQPPGCRLRCQLFPIWPCSQAHW